MTAVVKMALGRREMTTASNEKEIMTAVEKGALGRK